ncbi:MAG TPA: aspartate/glutamate racemase family protein [Burkholderiales bacterium]|nr:aspartate/glutamate racemase family protein [Burkholderiales bacterium]
MPRLLVINPNTTASITDLALRYVRAAVGEDIELLGTTGRFGCAYISSEACYAVAAHAVLDCYAEHGEGCDGVLLACFGEPGLFAMREACKVPVVGLAEASMQAAVERGGRFAIVTGGERWKPILERFAAMLGYSDRLAAVRTVSLTGGQIAENRDGAIEMLTNACVAAVDEDGADQVILGGAGLAGLAERIQPRVWAPVLDSVLIGARRAAALLRAPARSAADRMDTVPSIGVDARLAKLLR